MSLKSETKDAHKHHFINSRSRLFAKDMIFGKQKFDVQQLEDKQFYVWCETVEDEQIYKIIFGNWLLVPWILHLKYPRCAPANHVLSVYTDLPLTKVQRSSFLVWLSRDESQMVISVSLMNLIYIFGFYTSSTTNSNLADDISITLTSVIFYKLGIHSQTVLVNKILPPWS